MAQNTITQADLKKGAPWTFVHTGGPKAGEHTHYLYGEMIQPGGPGTDKQGGQPLSPTHTLLNPETGGLAYVSEKWLREGPIGNGQHGYWLLGHVSAEFAVAA
jgi:hypothetical protein